MPYRLVEKIDGSFKMMNKPRFEVKSGLRRDNSRRLRQLAAFSHNTEEWADKLSEGPFPIDPDDDLRTQKAIRQDRQEAVLATRRGSQVAVQLVAIFSPMLASKS